MINIERATKIADIDRRIVSLEIDMQDAWTNGKPTEQISEEISMLRQARAEILNTPPIPSTPNPTE